MDAQLAAAQQFLETLHSLSGVGSQLAGRLATQDGRQQLAGEAQQAAIQTLLGAATAVAAPTSPHDSGESDSAAANESQPVRTPTPPPVGSLISTGLSATGVGVGAAAPVAMGLLAAQQITDAFVDYGKTVQVEATKRAHIDAWRQTTLAQISTTRRVMELYLERTFDERRDNFKRMFDALDCAQENGDLKGMQLMLSGILDLAKSSPFKDLADFQQQLNNPDFVLEL